MTPITVSLFKFGKTKQTILCFAVHANLASKSSSDNGISDNFDNMRRTCPMRGGYSVDIEIIVEGRHGFERGGECKFFQLRISYSSTPSHFLRQ